MNSQRSSSRRSGPAAEFAGTERFEVRERLGEGAFGVVFEAWDRERQERVALKTLRHASAHGLYRFKQEFRGLADISHPNLVALHELHSHDDQYFFTMDLVEGQHLLDYVRVPTGAPTPRTHSDVAATIIADSDAGTGSIPSSPGLARTLPVEGASSSTDEHEAAPRYSGERIMTPANEARLRRTLVELARGLMALHDLGKLHRDIKPSNVLVTREGRVIILDFGLVSDVEADPSAPIESRVAGTPEYMSPEQATGLPASEASDWYSVGVVLYEALCGRLPFDGNIPTILAGKVLSEATPPSEFAQGIPADLEALCMDLLQRKAELRPSGRAVIERLGEAQTAVRQRSPRNVPLIGRAAHLEALEAAFQSAREHAVLVLLHGRSGMGKTTVVRRFLDSVRKREAAAVVLSGNCYEQESVPYKALDSLVDALGQYLKNAPADERDAVLPRNLPALARLFPVLEQLETATSSDPGVTDIPDAQELRRRAFGALREMLARLGERKRLVLFIDNLQWGDVDSAALLSEILEGADAPRMLLVATYRSEDTDASVMLAALRAALSRTAALDQRHIEVGELTEGDARALARALLGADDARADSLAMEARGSPFFIDELVRHAQLNLQNPTPERASRRPPPDAAGSAATPLDEVIWIRTRQLPPAARDLLDVIAVAGKPVPLGVVRAAAGSTGEVRGAIALLRSAHLIRTRGLRDRDDVETYHDRIRESLSARIEKAMVVELHRRLADSYVRSGDADDETLAVHLHAAGELPRAAEHYARAAQRAAGLLAFDRAARLFQLAIQLRGTNDSTTRQLQVQLGDALSHAGRGGEAAHAYLEAAADADPAESLQLRSRAVDPLLRSGRIDEGLGVLRGVIDQLKLRYPSSPQQALLSLLYHRARLRLRGLAFTPREEATLSREQLLVVDLCKSAAQGLAIVDTIRGADFQTQHALLALRLGEPYRAACALALEGGFTSLGGTRTQARTEKIFARTLELARTVDNPHALALAMLARGVSRCLEGQFVRCFEDSENAARIFQERCAVPWDLTQAQFYAMTALFWLGRIAELSSRIPITLRAVLDRSDVFAATSQRTYLLYYACMAADDVERGRREVRDALAQWSQQGYHVQHWWALMAESQMSLYAGDARDAWRRVASEWKPLNRSLLLQVQYALIEAHQLRARCALAAAREQRWKRPALAWSAERDAKVLERQNAPWADALATLIRASAAATRGHHEAALPLLARAEESFVRLEMKLYAAVTQRRRGELLGGETGRELVRSADGWMHGQGIRRPERFADAFAPGRWG